MQIGTYRTRGGRKAVVLCNDAPGDWPVIGYVVSPANVAHPRGWKIDGRQFYSLEQADDLLCPMQSPTVTIIEDDAEVTA